MTPRLFLFLIFILTVGFAACNKATPAGFWKNFKEDLLVTSLCDQGPWGGHRAIYWRSNKEQAFTPNEILKFAKKNGWTFVDSSSYNDAQTSKWVDRGQAVFPLAFTGFFDTIVSNTTSAYFPRWFNGEMKVYKFKTGWEAINPGTNDAIEENGFVVINSDGKQMAVYHLWGD